MQAQKGECFNSLFFVNGQSVVQAMAGEIQNFA